ncbi:hypothetical protein TREES_T100021440 [Tupaia chinensis]|uniref:Uncharacterized protein n=1 Tax=Tupaia chinensis TaxID=246437 RepID=L9L650_TUPCH|nr:hypothetical protein TREES_T100021440 [Tupaia chinensis]
MLSSVLVTGSVTKASHATVAPSDHSPGVYDSDRGCSPPSGPGRMTHKTGPCSVVNSTSLDQGSVWNVTG